MSIFIKGAYLWNLKSFKKEKKKLSGHFSSYLLSLKSNKYIHVKKYLCVSLTLMALRQIKQGYSFKEIIVQTKEMDEQTHCNCSGIPLAGISMSEQPQWDHSSIDKQQLYMAS